MKQIRHKFYLTHHKHNKINSFDELMNSYKVLDQTQSIYRFDDNNYQYWDNVAKNFHNKEFHLNESSKNQILHWYLNCF